VRLELELERERDPIEGRLVYEHGESLVFVGLLELMAAIEVVLAKASPGAPGQSETTGY